MKKLDLDRHEKLLILRISIGALLLAFSFVVGFLPIPEGASEIVSVCLCVMSYLLTGFDVVFEAIHNVFKGHLFDECFLMSLATLGALAIGEFREAAAVMVFYQAGELFTDIAVGKSRDSISALMNIRPDYADIYVNGEISRVSPTEVPAGSIIVVKPGEKIPLDGVITEGSAQVDTSALTGESMPQFLGVGDGVYGGSIDMSGVLHIRTVSEFGESAVAKIIRLVEESDNGKAKTEKFITRFARVYTPIVCILAVLFAVIPSLFDGMWGEWLHKALMLLVISCPCALVISVPLGFFGGIGGASRSGILFKGSNYLEALSRVRTVVFDKTGTLTKGCFSVVAVHPVFISADELLSIAALAEINSNHPIAVSLRAASKAAPDSRLVSEFEDMPGLGIRANVGGHDVCVGNGKLMEKIGAEWHECHICGTVVHVTVDGVYSGHIVISDTPKENSAKAIKELHAIGVERSVMLTGDKNDIGEKIAAELGINEVHAQLLPQDKVTCLDSIKESSHEGSVAFVGDGINDSPVLKRSDVGIAMGSLGSDAAIEAADVVIMDDDPWKVVTAVRIARRTMRIIKENIVFALAVKLVVLIFSVAGLTSMWFAVFADVGVTLLAVLNSLRAIRTK